MTLTFALRAAKSMPSATSKKLPSPSASSTLTGMSAHWKASPAAPSVLSVASATVEATCVPWKLSSLACESPLTMSVPCTKTVPPQSGALRKGPKSSYAIPVSRMATTTEESPFWMSHMRSALSMTKFHWSRE